MNAFIVQSPWTHINIVFPIAYYHCATLDAADIYRQHSEVVEGLDSIGLKNVLNVCDGAGEHEKFNNMTLTKMSVFDPTIGVQTEDDDAISCSDVPHLGKKARNNFMRSQIGGTKILCIDGFYIVWDVQKATYRVSKWDINGNERCPRSLVKMKYEVVYPTSIQQLRVDLALIPFSQEVQDFIKTPDIFDRVVIISNSCLTHTLTITITLTM